MDPVWQGKHWPWTVHDIMRYIMNMLTLCDTICHIDSTGNAGLHWPAFKVVMTRTNFVIMPYKRWHSRHRISANRHRKDPFNTHTKRNVQYEQTRASDCTWVREDALLCALLSPSAKSSASAVCVRPAGSVQGEGVYWPPRAFHQPI